MDYFQDCTCYASRKDSNKELNLLKNNLEKRIDILDKVNNPKKLFEINCSYIICSEKGYKPLKKQAVIKNNIYYFCSENCWKEWINKIDLNIYATSPSLISKEGTTIINNISSLIL